MYIAYGGICCFCRDDIPDHHQASCTADHLVTKAEGAPCRVPFIHLLCKPCDYFKLLVEEIHVHGPPLTLDEIDEGKQRGWSPELQEALDSWTIAPYERTYKFTYNMHIHIYNHLFSISMIVICNIFECNRANRKYDPYDSR